MSKFDDEVYSMRASAERIIELLDKIGDDEYEGHEHDVDLIETCAWDIQRQTDKAREVVPQDVALRNDIVMDYPGREL